MVVILCWPILNVIQPGILRLSACCPRARAHLLEAELRYFDQELADVFGFKRVPARAAGIRFLRANRMPVSLGDRMNGPVRYSRSVRAADPVGGCRSGGAATRRSNSAVIHIRYCARFRASSCRRPWVLSGFNPWSLWACGACEPPGRRYPWCGQFINLPRIKTGWRCLGFRARGRGRMCCYAPLSPRKWFAVSTSWKRRATAGGRLPEGSTSCTASSACRAAHHHAEWKSAR